MEALDRTNSTSDAVFLFTDSDFNNLRRLAYKFTGISLAEHKRDLVYGRLAKRLRKHGLTRFRDYLVILENDEHGEIEQFTNAITTNLTAFFREEHHFDHLMKKTVPELLERYKKTKKIRIWSAGCSTGEEPYSIAMALRESIPNIDSMDVKILATDLDSNVVRHAEQGIYMQSRIDGLDRCRIQRWFKRGVGANSGKVRVSEKLKRLISFQQLNLIDSWPMTCTFDVLFCRNVVIYFDKDTQKTLFERYANLLRPEGMLFIGHSETLHNVSDRFDLIGRTVYRKNS